MKITKNYQTHNTESITVRDFKVITFRKPHLIASPVNSSFWSEHISKYINMNSWKINKKVVIKKNICIIVKPLIITLRISLIIFTHLSKSFISLSKVIMRSISPSFFWFSHHLKKVLQFQHNYQQTIYKASKKYLIY